MGIEFSASLVWGCPVEGEYFDLEDAHKPHSDFELLLTGSQMTDYSKMVPFICIKKYSKIVCGKYEHAPINYLSLGTLQDPSKEEITQFLQWRFDNGFKTIQPPSGPLVGWHIIGSVS